MRDLHPYSHNANGHQFGPGGDKQWEAPTFKILWPFNYTESCGHVTNQKSYISTCRTPMATKLDKDNLQQETRTHKVTWPFKYVAKRGYMSN